MTRVLLINPPQRYFEKSLNFNIYFPIGLISIATVIKNVCEVKILDCLITNFEIKTTKKQVIYGTPFNKIKEIIKNYNPDIVGISTPFSTQKEMTKKISNICKNINKRLNKKILVVLGGPDVSVRYKELLKKKITDFCIVGEGEQTFLEFIKTIKSGKPLKNIKGLAYIQKDKIIYKQAELIQNLDKLPIPDYSLVSMNNYLNNKYLYIGRSNINKRSISIITSRGCPYNCVFCSIKSHMGQRYRYNSTDHVIKHIKLCIYKYGIKNFHFEDDNLTLNKKRFEKILDDIIKQKLRISWDTPNGVYVNSLDYKILKKMKKSGCKELTISLESGNQEVLNKIIKKKISLKYAIQIIQQCKKLKIRLKSFYVIGFSQEKKENIKETIQLALKLLKKYEVIPVMMFATPIYGTELYRISLKKKLIKKKLCDEDLSNATQIYGEPLIKSDNYSIEWLKKEVKKYLRQLKKELIIYSLKHPIYSIKKLAKRKNILKETGFYMI